MPKYEWCLVNKDNDVYNHACNLQNYFYDLYLRSFKSFNFIQGHKRFFSVGCLWHSHGKNPVRLYPKLQSQPIGLPKIFIDYLFFQADQSDCTKSVFSDFQSICFLWRTLKSERSLPNLSRLSFPTRGLGWLVNQRNPSRYWQVTKGDLSQIISSLHDSFLFRSSFFIRF